MQTQSNAHFKLEAYCLSLSERNGCSFDSSTKSTSESVCSDWTHTFCTYWQYSLWSAEQWQQLPMDHSTLIGTLLAQAVHNLNKCEVSDVKRQNATVRSHWQYCNHTSSCCPVLILGILQFLKQQDLSWFKPGFEYDQCPCPFAYSNWFHKSTTLQDFLSCEKLKHLLPCCLRYDMYYVRCQSPVDMGSLQGKSMKPDGWTWLIGHICISSVPVVLTETV